MADKDNKIHNKNPDKQLWDDYTHDIKPLKNKKVRNLKEPSLETEKRTRPTSSPTLPTDVVPSQKTQKSDRRTQENLRRGKFTIEARIDLHGMNREKAYDTLCAFIRSSYEGGRKCVLVITGKGGWQSADDLLMDRKKGVLRQSLPDWLSDPALAPYVLTWQSAKPKDGGDGAFYVLLRKKK